MTAVTLCSCGAVMQNGVCVIHCDIRGPLPHPEQCQHCRWLAHRCVICHTRCPSIPAAELHQTRCRRVEAAEERKARHD